MKAREIAGKIVTFADWAAIRPVRELFAGTCVFQGGSDLRLTKSLAKALGPKVQVNAIAPGPILLPPDLTEPEKQEVIDATVVKRIGSPQDIVNSVLFLIEGSDFITGHTLMVDGGGSIAGV